MELAIKNIAQHVCGHGDRVRYHKLYGEGRKEEEKDEEEEEENDEEEEEENDEEEEEKNDAESSSGLLS